MRELRGKVIYQDGEPVDEAVVEVYDYAEDEKKLNAYEVVRKKERRAACVTASDGSFCFTNLPSGKYALRAGALSSAGLNEMYMSVTLDGHWWSSWLRSGKEIELTLTPGT